MPPTPVRSRLQQRRGDAAGERHPAGQVAEGGPDQRLELGGVQRGGVADARPAPERGVVERAALAVGTLGTLAGGERVDEPRVPRPHVSGVEPQPGSAVRQQVRDQHVGAGQQVVEHGAAVVGGDVECDRSLAAVELLPHERDAVVTRRQALHRDATHRVGEARVRHLDHLGAPLGEDRAARRAERVHRQLDDSHPVERAPRCRVRHDGESTVAPMMRFNHMELTFAPGHLTPSTASRSSASTPRLRVVVDGDRCGRHVVPAAAARPVHEPVPAARRERAAAVARPGTTTSGCCRTPGPRSIACSMRASASNRPTTTSRSRSTRIWSAPA